MGWKLTHRDVAFQVLPVEREPMWDGNVRIHKNNIIVLDVEREPMWDGNSAHSWGFWYEREVEREPMWDGNEMAALFI